MDIKKNIANILTCSRILFSIILLLSDVFSHQFWVLYLFCGFSDMIDGTIARRTGTETKFGSILDSVADLIFMTTLLIRLLPLLCLPRWLRIWIFLIAVIKISDMILGFIMTRKLIFMHTVLNKFTGFLLFVLPLAGFIIDIRYIILLSCFFGTVASIQEWYYIWNDKE